MYLNKLFNIALIVSCCCTPSLARALTKAGYLAANIASHLKSPNKNLDGFTCAMWAKAIKNPQAVIQEFKKNLPPEDLVYIASVGRLHEASPYPPDEFGLRILLQASFHPKPTVAYTLKILEGCVEGAIDWEMLARSITHDIPQFENYRHHCLSKDTELIQLMTHGSQELSSLLSDDKEIRYLTVSESGELSKLIKEPVKLFFGFLNIPSDEWSMIEQRYSNRDHKVQRSVMRGFDYCATTNEFTVSNVTKALWYANRFLDMPVNFEKIHETLNKNERPKINLQTPPPLNKGQEIKLPPPPLHYNPKRSLSQSKNMAYRPRHLSGSPNQAFPSTTSDTLPTLTDETIYLLAVDILNAYKIGMREPYFTANLLTFGTHARVEVMTIETLTESLRELQKESGLIEGAARIIKSLEKDCRSDIAKKFKEYKPFIKGAIQHHKNEFQHTPLKYECIDKIAASLLANSPAFEKDNPLSVLFTLGMKFDEKKAIIDGKECNSENWAMLIKAWMKDHPDLATKEFLIAGLEHIKQPDIIDQVNDFYETQHATIRGNGKCISSSIQNNEDLYLSRLAKCITCYFLQVAFGYNVNIPKHPEIRDESLTNEQKAKNLLLHLIQEGSITLNNEGDFNRLKEELSAYNQNQTGNHGKIKTLEDVLKELPPNQPTRRRFRQL